MSISQHPKENEATERRPKRPDQDYQPRLQNAELQLPMIREICRAQSISIGVLHRGETVFVASDGLRQPDCDASPTTSYMLASCSKMFLAIAVGILVNDAKLHWDDTISKHIPHFDPIHDPNIGKNATIRDALSHRTGLGKIVTLIWGPNGSLLADRGDLLPLLNEASAANVRGNRFGRVKYHYNNHAYGLISLVVEKCSGQDLSTFLQERVLGPLRMKDTIVTSEGVKTSQNLALGYAKLVNSGEQFCPVSTPQITDENHPGSLSSCGIRSSVEDMLTLTKRLLEAQKGQFLDGNPLREVSEIWKPENPIIGSKTQYCKGFVRGPISDIGYDGLNSKFRLSDPQTYDAKFKLSSSDDMISHSGAFPGFCSSVNIFPGTESAIVALSNSLDLAESADIAARLFTQALFDLDPKVDMIAFARVEAEMHRQWYDNMVIEWQQHSQHGKPSEPEANTLNFIGKYRGLNTTIDVFPRSPSRKLAFKINGVAESICNLEFYRKYTSKKGDHFDTYSFTPLCRDEWLERGMLDWDKWHTGLFYFCRNDCGQVDAIKWHFDSAEKPGFFHRIPAQRASQDLSMPAPIVASLSSDETLVDQPLSPADNIDKMKAPDDMLSVAGPAPDVEKWTCIVF